MPYKVKKVKAEIKDKTGKLISFIVLAGNYENPSKSTSNTTSSNGGGVLVSRYMRGGVLYAA